MTAISSPNQIQWYTHWNNVTGRLNATKIILDIFHYSFKIHLHPISENLAPGHLITCHRAHFNETSVMNRTITIRWGEYKRRTI